MSGFALVFDSQEPITAWKQEFQAFKESVANYKQLHETCHEVSDQHYAAVKFDTSSTLHQGITVDEQTGSWLMAAGTVLDRENNPDDGNLQFLLRNYLNLGDTVFQNLDGAFALVICNRSTNTLKVVSDPLGLLSIFYAQRKGRIYVASSALAVAKAVQATPSEYGAYLFLSTGMVLDKFTLWQEVERLKAGTVLEVTPTNNTKSVYWIPAVSEEITRLTINETVDYALDILTKLTKHHLEREGKTWADLTGGFDSRLVTMIMDYCGLSFKGNCQGPQDSPDVRISSHIAQKLGWDYQHFTLPDDWGEKRGESLSRALGKGDAHLDVFKLTSVLWNQDQRALEYNAPIWGLGGEVWRGTIWKQEFWNIGRTPLVDYDRLVDYRLINSVHKTILNDPTRIDWIREELKSLLKNVGDRYADAPNNVKLDCIFAFKTTGHTGSHISSVMGIQRAIAPLFFKDSISFAVSTHYKWRRHSRLVRLLLEKANPVLASISTTDGGPALPMRLSNIHKFKPYWTQIGKQLVRKTSKKFLGQSLLSPSRSEFASYPRMRWRRDTLNYIEQDNILDYADMRSACLYDADSLSNFLKEAHTEEFKHEIFLSRVLTVEMALRSVGTSF